MAKSAVKPTMLGLGLADGASAQAGLGVQRCTAASTPGASSGAQPDLGEQRCIAAPTPAANVQEIEALLVQEQLSFQFHFPQQGTQQFQTFQQQVLMRTAQAQSGSAQAPLRTRWQHRGRRS